MIAATLTKSEGIKAQWSEYWTKLFESKDKCQKSLRKTQNKEPLRLKKNRNRTQENKE